MCHTPVALIIIDINNKNSESDVGVNVEDQRSIASAIRHFLPLPVLRQTAVSMKSQTVSSDCYFLPPYIPLSAKSVLVLKVCDSQVLGLKL